LRDHGLDAAYAPILVFLRNMIVSGAAKPSFVVSHHISFEEVEDAYTKFDQRKDGYVKVVLQADR
jgi:glutathione-independent formaldehyde dehydrogenase